MPKCYTCVKIMRDVLPLGCIMRLLMAFLSTLSAKSDLIYNRLIANMQITNIKFFPWRRCDLGVNKECLKQQIYHPRLCLGRWFTCCFEQSLYFLPPGETYYFQKILSKFKNIVKKTISYHVFHNIQTFSMYFFP